MELADARKFASKIIDSPIYQKSILDRVKSGTLDPHTEEMLWSIGHGAVRRRRSVERDLVAELARRLAVALRDGDLTAARAIWDNGKLITEIEHVLR